MHFLTSKKYVVRARTKLSRNFLDQILIAAKFKIQNTASFLVCKDAKISSANCSANARLQLGTSSARSPFFNSLPKEYFLFLAEIGIRLGFVELDKVGGVRDNCLSAILFNECFGNRS